MGQLGRRRSMTSEGAPGEFEVKQSRELFRWQLEFVDGLIGRVVTQLTVPDCVDLGSTVPREKIYCHVNPATFVPAQVLVEGTSGFESTLVARFHGALFSTAPH